MWVMVAATVISVLLALGLLAVVAVSSGHVRRDPRLDKFNEFADQATKTLNGETEPPQRFTELVTRS